MHTRSGRALSVAGILLCAAVHAAAEQAATLTPARFATPPVIDGRLDDEVWAGAARLEGFRQVHPGDNIDPSQPTELLVGYDRRALYLAFRAHDASGPIRATLARRDAIEDDDVVGVYLDTFRDQRRAYYIFFNPYGIQADGIYTEGQAAPDLTVDLVVRSKGMVGSGGYTVEAEIPFASLRYQPGDAVRWGLHVQRVIRRDRGERISWRPLSRDRSSLLDQAGVLGDMTGIGEGRPIEVTGAAVATQTGRATAAGFSDGPAEIDPGITVNVGITPTLNAAATVNPDFAQVEADQLLLTVNQRFPLFYDEKRPFFLEGLDTFHTPMPIVHTRAIVAPDAAVKLTGKQGRTSIGVLVAADGATKSVVRVKRDIGRESTIGLAGTDTREAGRFSSLGSVDARLRLDERTVFTAQVVGTTAHMPFRDADAGGVRERRGSGLGYHAVLERRSRHWVVGMTAAGTSPDYRADLGFTRRVNTNAVSLQTSYNSEPRTEGRLVSWTITNVTLAQWDWQGRANFVYVYPQLHLAFRRQSFVRLLAFRDYERIFEEEFGARRAPGRGGAFAGDGERSTSWEGFVLQAGSAPSEAWAFSATVSRSWDVFDYDFGGGTRFPRVSPAALANPDGPLDPGPATSRSIGGELTWRPSDALRTSLDASRNTLVRNDTGLAAYDATLVSWKTTYQFTPFTFVRLRTDWDSAFATLRGQYLFGWTPTPGTAVYAGYNEAADIDGVDPLTGVAIRGYRRTSRTAFVKISYRLQTIF